MSAIMKVLLTDHAAEAQWGDKAFLSFNQGGAVIHLTGDESECLRVIQRAGRRLDAQGVKQVALVGSDWDLERRYAFYQGFYIRKIQTKFLFRVQIMNSCSHIEVQ